MSARNFLLVDQSLPIFQFNVGGVVVDNLIFRFSFARSALEVFAIKVESCQKQCQILDVFHSPKYQGVGVQNCTRIITPASQHVTWNSILRLLPVALKFQSRNVQEYNGQPGFLLKDSLRLGSMPRCCPVNFFQHALQPSKYFQGDLRRRAASCWALSHICS